MRRSGCRGAWGLLEQAWGEGARIWRQLWGRPGYQRWSEAAPCQGAGSQRWHSSWLEAELAEAGAAFLCRQGQKGHLARPLLAETHPVAPSELLPPCPTWSSLCLPRTGRGPCQTCPSSTLHPLQRGGTALHAGFQGMMCTLQGVQLPRRGVGRLLFQESTAGSCQQRALLLPSIPPPAFLVLM